VQTTFGTKFFEDQDRKKKFSNIVISGKPQNEIEESFKDIPKEKIRNEVESVKKNIDISKFWDFNKKGEIEIKPYRLKIYLEEIPKDWDIMYLGKNILFT
jgi:hypothetical protein